MVSCLLLGPNFGVRLATDKTFCLQLMVDRIRAFVVFNEKYLRSYGCSDTNFTAAVNCTNLKTEIKSTLIELQF